jgi:prenyltransferase beta subunit
MKDEYYYLVEKPSQGIRRLIYRVDKQHTIAWVDYLRKNEDGSFKDTLIGELKSKSRRGHIISSSFYTPVEILFFVSNGRFDCLTDDEFQNLNI